MCCLHVCLHNERDVFFWLRVMHSQRLNCRIDSWHGIWAKRPLHQLHWQKCTFFLKQDMLGLLCYTSTLLTLAALCRTTLLIKESEIWWNDRWIENVKISNAYRVVKPDAFLSFTFVCLLQLFFVKSRQTVQHQQLLLSDPNFWSWPILCHQSMSHTDIQCK